MIRPIAFDLGKNFGFAFRLGPLAAGSLIHAGHFEFEGARAARQGELLTYLTNLLEEAKANLDIVVYETPFARGRDATRCGWGQAGIIEAVATSAGLPVLDVAVSTIKKFATADGHAPKTAMIDAARKMGYTGKNEHEADAVCLLRYAEENCERVP